jgi:serine/threonine protein kinase
MPPPVNADEFLAVVEKSGLLAEGELDDYRYRAAADPAPPDRIANWMVTDGRLTPFQVGLLLAGKYRPFFVGSYKVLSRLGNGSMGVVYLCEHKDMRRRVAVKILQSRRVHDQVALERFFREARAAAHLNHPNVVHAIDVGFESGLHYLVMEYINGKSLKEMVLKDGPLPPLVVANYLWQAAQGIQHAHEAGLIHRDLKPSNIMIDRSGVVKLLDLGLARFNDEEVDLTRGATLGSMAFAAPEQMEDSHSVDARADVYSLGATFYLALCGRPPIGVGVEAPPPPRPSDTQNFTRVMSVLRKMIAVSRTERYQSAAEVVAELASWAMHSPPSLGEPAQTESDPDLHLDTETDGDEVEIGKVPATKSSLPPPLPAGHDEEVSGPTASSFDFSLAPPAKANNAKPRKVEQKKAVPPPRQKAETPAREKAETPARPWWQDRKWQLIVLGLAMCVGLVAALAGRSKSSPNQDPPSKVATSQ